MAQVRARISCQTDCAALNPSTNVVFDDVWTDPVAAGRAPDASFAYRYADLDHPGADVPGLRDGLAARAAGSRSTTSSTSTRCGAGRA